MAISSNPEYLTNVNGTLFFNTGGGIWKSNGTESGTLQLSSVRAGGFNKYPVNLTNVNGTLFFRANDGSSGYELWKSDGTVSGTTLVKDILVGSSSGNPLSLTAMNGILFFSSHDGIGNIELWKSDGTAAGTVIVKDINVPGIFGSYPIALTNIHGTLYFSANDGVGGQELWKSDGSEAGTTQVLDVAGPGDSNPANITITGSKIFFTATTNTYGRELYVIAANSAPTNLALSNVTINENAASGSAVGNLNTTDSDTSDSFTYALVSGVGSNDNARFQIVGNQLRTTVVFNYEVKPSYTIRIRSTDAGGASIEKSLTISVNDLPELVGQPVFGDGTAQRSLITQMTMVFDGAVTIGAGAFSVMKRGVGGGVVVTNVSSVLNNSGQTVVTLTFSGGLTRGSFNALTDGYYQLTIDGTKITRGGRGLDANQDGIGGDTLTRGNVEADKFFALYGDGNGDGLVNAIDFFQFRLTNGRRSSDAGYNAIYDYDGSVVNALDFVQFRNRNGKPKMPWN